MTLHRIFKLICVLHWRCKKMKFFDLISIMLIVAHLIDVSVASLHTWGERGYFDRNTLVDTKLFEYNSTIPKNYTIFYTYYQNHYKPVSYIEINVTSESEGDIRSSPARQWYYGEHKEIKAFTANIRINNATDVLANVTIYEKDYVPFSYVHDGGPENNESLTICYIENAIPSPKPYYGSSIGKRQNGDELLHFEKSNVRNFTRFPSKAFSYNGEEYITYVRFSFNSPTAMVLVNTSFVGEREFSAAIYDMNSEHFAANFSVFGIKSEKRPKEFIGIVDLRK